MRFFHPKTVADFSARDRLLTHALRAEWAPFPIATEYPLVLSESGVHTSYCLGEGETILAHANLWPRLMIDQQGTREIRIGLVGNVATDAAHRGQGLMRRLLEKLKAQASTSGLSALVLWSDLLEFYQKQGFSSCGQEARYVFHTKRLPASKSWRQTAPVGTDLRRCLDLRLPVPTTLARSVEEFAALLTIPATDFLRHDSGYLVMGKGVDMLGVVHEWGAPDPETLLGGLRTAAAARNFDECMLLAPATLAPEWHSALAAHAVRTEIHPMALMWTPEGTDPATRSSLASSFIWGLDSI